MLSNYLSFEKPLGEMLTRLLFYIGILVILFWGLRSLWHYLTWFDNDWDEALSKDEATKSYAKKRFLPHQTPH
mgnify:CR=1 FL=1